MPQPPIAAVILAAGKSTRMKSDTPKVLHEVCGRPMIEYVLEAARQAGATRLIVVVGHQADRVQAALSHHPDVEFALQAEQKGTGHAVMMCRDQLADHDGPVLVLTGDTPLLREASLQALLNVQQRHQAACVVGTARTEQNEGLGRIVRDSDGHFVRIVEQKDASPEELKIPEINTGCFAYDCRSLFEALARVRPNNRQQELYLTDCAEILRRADRTVVAACEFDVTEAMGVNTPQQLEEVEKTMHPQTGS
jgi:bifunctional UDP-N-acetylglucosamine pyrophosphorylase / glucosamine-1-phosphate N-acetyltransferase